MSINNHYLDFVHCGFYYIDLYWSMIIMSTTTFREFWRLYTMIVQKLYTFNWPLSVFFLVFRYSVVICSFKENESFLYSCRKERGFHLPKTAKRRHRPGKENGFRKRTSKVSDQTVFRRRLIWLFTVCWRYHWKLIHLKGQATVKIFSSLMKMIYSTSVCWRYHWKLNHLKGQATVKIFSSLMKMIYT